MEELRGIQTTTPLACAFFSVRNIDALQQTIRYQVWLKSNKQHIIGKQNEYELKVVMRSIYLTGAKHMDSDIAGQVRLLNKKVLEFCVNAVFVQLQQYVAYTQHISENHSRHIIDHSMNTSIRGSRQLEMNPW
jgi:hypothetical protein